MYYKEIVKKLRKWANGDTCDDCPAKNELAFQAADAINALLCSAEEAKARADGAEAQLDAALSDLGATRAALAEAHGFVGGEPKTLFGVPLARLHQLAEADKAGRCMILPDFGEAARRALENLTWKDG